MKKFVTLLSLMAFIFIGCPEPVEPAEPAEPAEPTIYTVTFNSNGGTGTMNPQSFTAGVAQELAANTFERKNYTFIGWSEDSKATSATYGDKAKFTARKDTPLYAVWEPRWLTFTSDSPTALITSYVNDEPDGNGKVGVPNGMEYSTDGKTWNAFTEPQGEIQFGNGTELYLRGKSSWGTAQDEWNYINFTFKENTKVSASGDICTLVDWENPANADTSKARFCRLFANCTQLVTTPKLPAANLADYCYSYMFRGCTSLKTAPELPAPTLAEFCYEYMFYGCTGLTKAPALPVTILANFCYWGMFDGCKSLTTAPELEATSLATGCYGTMFSGCEKLASVTMLATNVSAASALQDWLGGTAENGTLYVNSTMVGDETITGSLPSGKNWTVKDVKDKTN